jgi:penicillin-binding protein 1C
VILLLAISYANCLPDPLFEADYSTVLEDRSGNLLGARIAKDGQWRFPPLDRVPNQFAQAIITFEDKRFYSHPGVDPLAMGRALRLNLQQGEVVSGGSTLSMQVIRLARDNPPADGLAKADRGHSGHPTGAELQQSRNPGDVCRSRALWGQCSGPGSRCLEIF